ncbi:CDP-glycerol glycerophosphotransferase family protein [Lacticaseibacillus nasuensis]|uniref:CDP-glycerol glycerophosphotransferase family protein n=1 Tax=Lacticaseibacillus nasuensis TaxID=944671 RepID=UPI002247653D|nr:CDP-glycerol glycerophosphotransferase family protein [Lacticaseibacillus nasuensis]MCX2456200.1 CDP-glycerol glycerophosphotransferase family protein [Lacticaseibacillus nasuensis]
MKTIALIGFNLLSPGGTSRSNLNMMSEFLKAGYEVTFFNYKHYTRGDLRRFRRDNPEINQIIFHRIDELKKINQFDYTLITRESFFPLAEYLRGLNPHAKIIGEINTALPLVNLDEISTYFQYFDKIRVATPSVQRALAAQTGYQRTYVQTVSLAHLFTDVDQVQVEPAHVDADAHINLLVRSRFESSKDIPYSLQLLDFLINYEGHTEFRFYITGYGPGNRLLHNLTEYYHLEDYVFFNEEEPANYIYLSTSSVESFGYSIAEAFAAGHSVAMYQGDDDVVKENFADFEDCVWLVKDVEKDAQALLAFAKTNQSQAGFEHNLALLREKGADFVGRFESAVAEASTQPAAVADVPDFLTVKQAIEVRNINDGLEKYRTRYYRLRHVPVIGRIVQIKWLKKTGLKILRAWAARHESAEVEAVELDPEKVFVESFHGTNFSGDPKYLALEYQREHPNATIYVSSINSLVDLEIRRYGFTPLRTGSKYYVYRFMQCKYIVINGNSLDMAGKLPGQVFIQTWHGFPMKKMVNDLEDRKQRKRESEAFAPRMQKWDFLTASSDYNVELLRSAFALSENPQLKVLANGTPKNAYLLAHADDQIEKDRIFEKYFNRPATHDKKFILFCPTWRKGGRDEVSELNLVDVIHALPDEYELIVKLHPNEGGLRKEYSDLDDRIHCFYNELTDIQELYLLSDVLISDYSSAIFDYALLNKRVIVLQEDEESYSHSIGWYFDIQEECHLVAHNYTADELVEAILTDDGNREYDHLIKERLLTNEKLGSAKEIWETVAEA